MALFTDGPASTIEDLAAQDSQLLNVANSEGIDLTVKLGLAQEAIGIELEELLRRGSSFHLSQVVVTPAVRLWHTYRTLEWVYRDAYHSQLNDRYAGKRDQFRELSKWAYNRVIQAGVGITPTPVPRASGLTLQPTGTGSLPAGTYYASMAWANAAGEEGECSAPAAIELTDGSFTAYPPPAPAEAAGWNLYAGTEPEDMVRQNPAPLPCSQEWESLRLEESGPRPGKGQNPSLTHAIPRVLQRG
jgi:hypothetical protein